MPRLTSAAIDNRISEMCQRANSLEKKLLHQRKIDLQIPIEELEKLYIRTKKNNRPVLFRIKQSQRIIVEEINDMIRHGVPVRTVLLKARKFGGSTLFSLITYYLVKTYAMNAYIIGHIKESSNNLYDMVLTAFLKDSDIDGNKEIDTERRNRKELIFSSGGSIKVVTAGTKDAVTSTTNQIVLCTEMALWEGDPDAQMRSLLNTVSDAEPFTFIFIESTARGVGNTYHNCWSEAKSGFSGYRPIFIGWLQCKDELAIRFDGDTEKFFRGMNAEEVDLCENHGASFENILWRRRTIRAKSSGKTPAAKLADFYQEYPTYPEQAFLQSGSPIFDTAKLMRMLNGAQEPVFEGEMNTWAGVRWSQVMYDGDEYRKGFSENVGGSLKIWEWPIQGKHYDIGADVAEGIKGGDKSTAVIRERKTGKVVATWAGKLAPEDFGDVLTDLGLFYNQAFVEVECNNHGNTVTTRMWKQYPRHCLYMQRFGQNMATAEEGDRIGFLVTPKNKPWFLDQAAFSVRRNEAEMHDKDLIKELLTIKHENNKIPTNGLDLAMAFVHSEECRLRMPWSETQRMEKTLHDDWLAMRRENKAMIEAQRMGITRHMRRNPWESQM